MTQVELSVVVPTFGRPERVRQLLDRCKAQTLAPSRFEVVLVDDGSPVPLAVDRAAHRFRVSLLRQENAGPGAARNLAIERCRAPLTLFLNDDAVPSPELFAKHLEVHSLRTDNVAVLGSFTFTEEALCHPFVQVLAESDLLFDFERLVDGALHPWTYFWTCNLSLPTAALQEAGGFDSGRFREALVEDVELGYRLFQKGWRVLFRADARCEHDHVVTSEAYFRRQLRLGVNLARMYEKHGDPQILSRPQGVSVDARFRNAAQATVEAYWSPLSSFQEKLARLERGHDARPLPADMLSQLRVLTRRLGLVAVYRGMLLEFEGHDIAPVLERGATPGRLTSIIAISYNGLDATRRCLEALRAARDESFPTELLFVDNGSTDGSAEFLAEQADVTLIRNRENLGAPRARNQALARARGDWLVFLDNDAMVTPGWLERLLYHAEVDAKSGCVGPTSDRSAHGQQLVLPASADSPAPAELARRLAVEKHRQHRASAMLSSFCVLVHREVVEQIGGFDERFSPWGFEDDDFTLRATLAGFKNRIALDAFVRHEAYAGPKLARQTQLLEQNARRFAEKWGLPIESTQLGDDARIAPVLQRVWTRETLFVPFETVNPAGALPESSARKAAPSEGPRA